MGSRPFPARIHKRLSNHLDKPPLINPNLLAAQTAHFLPCLIHLIQARNPIFVTAQHFPFANLVIFPQLAFTRRTFDRQHSVNYTGRVLRQETAVIRYSFDN